VSESKEADEGGLSPGCSGRCFTDSSALRQHQRPVGRRVLGGVEFIHPAGRRQPTTFSFLSGWVGGWAGWFWRRDGRGGFPLDHRENAQNGTGCGPVFAIAWSLRMIAFGHMLPVIRKVEPAAIAFQDPALE